MIKATELSGRAVIDIDAAEKIGKIKKLILDPEGKGVAGFVVSRGGFPGNREQTIIPSSAVCAIGPDAVTVKQAAVAATDVGRLESLPRGSDVIGRKVVTNDGRYLGKVDDVLIERAGGCIFGYVLTDHKGRGKHPYLPAGSNLRAGRDLIVASEEAMKYEWKDEDEPSTTRQWSDPTPAEPYAGREDSGRETNPRVE
jgi:sporulation protein YlmC with PRC-barrel domain